MDAALVCRAKLSKLKREIVKKKNSTDLKNNFLPTEKVFYNCPIPRKKPQAHPKRPDLTNKNKKIEYSEAFFLILLYFFFYTQLVFVFHLQGDFYIIYPCIVAFFLFLLLKDFDSFRERFFCSLSLLS